MQVDSIPVNESVPPKRDFSSQIRSLLHCRDSKAQNRIIFIFMLTALFSNLHYSSSNLFYMNPAFHCQQTLEKQTEEYACRIIEHCNIVNPQTVTAQLSLYCGEKMHDRVLIQSSSGIGGWFGLIFSAIISDLKGRKFAFSLSLIMLCLACIIQYIGIVYQIIPLLILEQIVSGFCGKAIYFNFLILSTRFLRREAYETVAMSWLLVSGFIEMSTAILNELFHSWRLLYWIYSAGMTFSMILVLIFLHEDPIYFFDRGEYSQCKAIIATILQENGQSQQDVEEKLKEVDRYASKKEESDQLYQDLNDYNIKEVMRCDIVTNILVLGFIGCFYSMAGWSIDLSIQSLQLSYNYNLFLVGGSKIIGYILAIYVLRIERQRKRGFLTFSALCGIAGFMFAFDFCIDNSIIESVAIAFLRIFLCVKGNFSTRLKIDLFPKKYQALLVGVVEFMGNSGKTFCPLLTQVSNQLGLSPIFAINILHITAGTLPIFFLNNRKLELGQGELCAGHVKKQTSI